MILIASSKSDAVLITSICLRDRACISIRPMLLRVSACISSLISEYKASKLSSFFILIGSSTNRRKRRELKDNRLDGRDKRKVR